MYQYGDDFFVLSFVKSGKKIGFYFVTICHRIT